MPTETRALPLVYVVGPIVAGFDVRHLVETSLASFVSPLELDEDALSSVDAVWRTEGEDAEATRAAEFAAVRGIPVFHDFGPLVTWLRDVHAMARS